MIKRFLVATASAAALLMGSAAYAGPFILAGTDADDHGGTSASANVTGWLFMQKALENLAPGVTNGKKVVTILGSTSTAAVAANSAFSFSSLVGAGWAVNTVSLTDFGTFFGVGGGLTNSGILMMDSGSNNVSGGVSGNNYTPYASAINSFVGAGGGLFSQGNGYQWLSNLVPSLSVIPGQHSGLSVTSQGSSAFPGLVDADLSSGPWHSYFNNTGAIPILAVSTDTSTLGRAVIIGGATGSITDPGTVPEPGTLALLAVALGAAGMLRKKKTA